ncbi:hypothetical protein [Methylobacterium nodulans]|uniref:Uncharacterized protein n=1 Tax=Methylobacterium nodulans (strain LMG 21967 / CNCM I-2342 / ORS 2060) TaxID=460265 RepID=B8IE54_METNO|nr:hypothetical protein [Methylobacterium nodulans]ACL57600.1 conserved hypothetical protein [Methylobacterium nodulans ORS 2060]
MRIRWSDNDRYFGPFTYARAERGYRPLAIVLGSGDDDDYPGCRLRVSGFGHTLILALPAIIKPWRRKVYAQTWDAATIERLGRDWYWDSHERQYGVSVSDGFLQVFLGAQTHDSTTTQSWSCFLPWTQWRHARSSFYGLEGEHFWTEPPRRGNLLGAGGWWAARHAAEEACPSRTFAFTDFDGEALTARTRIEEREWHFGTGWFKWLSLFRRPKIRRSLDIRFSGETGQRKGSWKGGTIGHSIDMLPGELHEAAFRRYCTENNMSFGGAL